MHPFLALCSLPALDFAFVHLFGVLLAPLLSSQRPLLLVWLVGLARLGVLTLGVQAVSVRYKLPSWLQRAHLLLLCAVLSFLVPSYVTLTALVLPRSSAELLNGSGHWDVFLLCYLLTVTSAILLYQLCPPSEEEEQGAGKAPSASLGRLIVLLQPDVGRFLLVAVFVVLSSWGEMALPFYTGRMTDWILNKEDPSAFRNAITAMSLITIGSAVTEFFCDCLYNVTMSRIHTRTQGQLLRSVLRQDIAFFDSVPTGDITSRVTTDIKAMSESLSSDLSLLMWYLMRAIFLSSYMLSVSPKLTLFTLQCLCVIMLVPKLSGTFYQDLAVRVQESLSKANQVAEETFSNMKTVRSFANEEGEYRRYERKLQDTYQLNKMEAMSYGCSNVANSVSTTGGYRLVFVMSLQELLRTRIFITSG
ncbi:hypothetical protein FKM82_020437 [Ascaphus truei]